ncbi:MAG: glycosyltransferase [Candidatus Schekmanbacteria bacterium]|nr:MAG: glycosyltransferase [Candidatus Schekmanbacteria bacterium]
MIEKTEICGLRFSNAGIERMLDETVKLFFDDRKHMIFPANVESIMLAEKDPFLKEIYNKSTLLLADGMPIIWASKILKRPIVEKISGPDFLPMMLRKFSPLNKSVFFLGGEKGVAERACQNLCKKIKNLKIAGTMHGFFRKEGVENETVVKRINSTGASLLVVAFGTPLQEKWIFNNIEKLDIKVAIGVGAAIDFISGEKKRAPRWMSNSGLEWFHRLINEPSRLWRRYLLRDSLFPLLLIRNKLKNK